ncbi:MAG: hypothetical protein COV36_00435 [Alphaproteobacteria bacterium CG11_big_fil_rev_8_21_14_0_20_44_7]|nr:MAG: hypothetical protein COV36_00435 [Alphaproteobacteria bacterium CG11_big_fil_rev_8_21_14_0_20_44_7]
MKISYEKIESLLTKEDIEGLIGLGAPQDEYENEAKKIYEAILELPDSDNNIKVSRIIMDIWKQSFNLSKEELKQRLPFIERLTKSLLIEP